MRFLIDACLPREFSPLLISHGHVAIDARDVGLGSADDAAIARHAQQNHLCLLTEDRGFGDVRRYPPEAYDGIVVFAVPDGSIHEKVAALRKFLERREILDNLPRRLAIVTLTRIRFRPPL